MPGRCPQLGTYCLLPMTLGWDFMSNMIGAWCRVESLACLFSYIFPVCEHNYLYFHKYSRFVPTFFTAALCFHRHSRSVPSLFEIPAASRSSDAEDMLSIAAVCVKSLVGPDCLLRTGSCYSQTDQRASSRRQAAPTRSRTIHNSQFGIFLRPSSAAGRLVWNGLQVMSCCVWHTSTFVGYYTSGRVSRATISPMP